MDDGAQRELWFIKLGLQLMMLASAFEKAEGLERMESARRMAGDSSSVGRVGAGVPECRQRYLRNERLRGRVRARLFHFGFDVVEGFCLALFHHVSESMRKDVVVALGSALLRQSCSKVGNSFVTHCLGLAATVNAQPSRTRTESAGRLGPLVRWVAGVQRPKVPS